MDLKLISEAPSREQIDRLQAETVQLPFGVVPFTNGDAYGPEKRKLAINDAKEQLKVLPDGIRHKLYELQAAMDGLPDVECPLQHTFAPGVYVRTIFIPAGSVVVGKIHKHSHANVLSQGHVTVLTEGGGLQELHGPLTMVSEPGTKRAVYAHTDTVWTTIHPTDKTKLSDIEEETIAKNYEDYEQFARLRLGEQS